MELPIRTSEELAQAVADCDLPSISGIAAQLVATLSEDQVDITYLRDLIAQDPTLTAAVLRWANSPIFGAARRVNTLEAAISILGLSRVRARTIAFFVRHAFDPPRGMDRESFWASCMHSAGYAMWLAVATGLNESEAWLTAMMARLGELVIGAIDPDTVTAVESPALPAQQRWELERQRLGFDEGAVMAVVIRMWFFPDTMVEALHKCARPLSSMAFSPLAAVVHLAALLADRPAVDAQGLQELPAEVMAALGLDAAALALHIPERASFTTLGA